MQPALPAGPAKGTRVVFYAQGTVLADPTRAGRVAICERAQGWVLGCIVVLADWTRGPVLQQLVVPLTVASNPGDIGDLAHWRDDQERRRPAPLVEPEASSRTACTRAPALAAERSSPGEVDVTDQRAFRPLVRLVAPPDLVKPGVRAGIAFPAVAEAHVGRSQDDRSW
eukprot:3832231-Alexandrium_andersonii.AAC.1